MGMLGPSIKDFYVVNLLLRVEYFAVTTDSSIGVRTTTDNLVVVIVTYHLVTIANNYVRYLNLLFELSRLS